MTNNEKMKCLAEAHNLSRDEIAKLTFSARRTVDAWFQERYQIPDFKLNLLKGGIEI